MNCTSTPELVTTNCRMDTKVNSPIVQHHRSSYYYIITRIPRRKAFNSAILVMADYNSRLVDRGNVLNVDLSHPK